MEKLSHEGGRRSLKRADYLQYHLRPRARMRACARGFGHLPPPRTPPIPHTRGVPVKREGNYLSRLTETPTVCGQTSCGGGEHQPSAQPRTPHARGSTAHAHPPPQTRGVPVKREGNYLSRLTKTPTVCGQTSRDGDEHQPTAREPKTTTAPNQKIRGRRYNFVKFVLSASRTAKPYGPS